MRIAATTAKQIMLQRLRDAEDDIKVVGEAADGEQAIEVVRRECPDVVLMDIRMPELGGLPAAERILALLKEEEAGRAAQTL